MNKYLTHYLALFTLSLSGCSSTPVIHTLTPVEATPDPQCLSIAKYARAITFLKGAGIPSYELDSYTQVPVAVIVPVAMIQAKVASTDYPTPAAAYSDMLTQCEQVGWARMSSSLESQLPVANLKLDHSLSPVTVLTPTKPKRKTLRPTLPR